MACPQAMFDDKLSDICSNNKPGDFVFDHPDGECAQPHLEELVMQNFDVELESSDDSEHEDSLSVSDQDHEGALAVWSVLIEICGFSYEVCKVCH